jgi:hypothetical protein
VGKTKSGTSQLPLVDFTFKRILKMLSAFAGTKMSLAKINVQAMKLN